jgi:anti-anti-sigma factor
VSVLHAVVAAGEAGPLITLSGETDVTTTAELTELVAGQLADGALQLTVDMSELRFADTASIRVLVLAARTLRQRGGNLVLLRPHRALARILQIMGADQLIAVQEGPESTPEPES